MIICDYALSSVRIYVTRCGLNSNLQLFNKIGKKKAFYVVVIIIQI